MTVDSGIWNRLTQLVVALLVAAVLVGVGFWYVPLIRQNERMRKEVARLEEETAREAARGRELDERIHALTRDPAAVERAAREKLNLSKPDETIFRFEEPDGGGRFQSRPN
jgi:cell division protein FtsB